MSRTAGSLAPAAWEMVSVIVSSTKQFRGGSVAQFQRRARCRWAKKTAFSSEARAGAAVGLLRRPGRIEAGKIAIGFGIAGPANSLAIFDHGRTATRLPGRARLRIGLLFLRRPRRDGANHCAAVDAEIGGLAGAKGSSRSNRGCLVRRSGGCGPRRSHDVCGVSMVHRK